MEREKAYPTASTSSAAAETFGRIMMKVERRRSLSIWLMIMNREVADEFP